MKTAQSDQLLTRQEAAEYLGIQPCTLSAWAASGKHGLRFYRVGHAIRYRRSDLEAWLASRVRTSTAD